MRLKLNVFSFLCLTSEIAEHHRRCSKSWKHSVWRRGGRRNFYYHWARDNKSCEGQNGPLSILDAKKRHCRWQMCSCFPAVRCWWYRPGRGPHSQETHCQRRGGDSRRVLVPHNLLSPVYCCFLNKMCLVRTFVHYRWSPRLVLSRQCLPVMP